MRTKILLALVGGLVIGLLAGLALGGHDGEPKAAGPGPTKTVDGVPAGFAQSRDGAVAAADAFSRTISRLALEDMEDRHRALARLSTAANRDAVRSEADEAFKVIDEGLGLPDAKADVVLRSATVGYQVTSFSESNAVVEIWSVDVVGKAGAIPPQAGWGVSTFSLTWEADDWKLSAFPKQEAGPTPALQGRASPLEDLPRIHDLEELPNGAPS